MSQSQSPTQIKDLLTAEQASATEQVLREESALREHLVVHLSGAHAYGFNSQTTGIANLDQIGHLGNYDLAVKAAKYVDEVIELVHSATRDRGWTLLITSDHGNADLMIDAEGKSIGSHSDRPVPFVVATDSPGKFRWLARRGSLANVAATLLTMMGIQPPTSMAASLVEPLASAGDLSNVGSLRAG